MGEKKCTTFDPYNDYVLDLGANKPPALPEKELAEERGENRYLAFLYISAILVGFSLSFIVYLAENADPAGTGTTYEESASLPSELLASTSSDPTEEPDTVWMTVWLNDEIVEEENLHLVQPGDKIEVFAYSADAQIEAIWYFFGVPDSDLLHEISDNETSIILPEWPLGASLRLWILAEDTNSNDTGWKEYIFTYHY